MQCLHIYFEPTLNKLFEIDVGKPVCCPTFALFLIKKSSDIFISLQTAYSFTAETRTIEPHTKRF